MNKLEQKFAGTEKWGGGGYLRLGSVPGPRDGVAWGGGVVPSHSA